MVSVRMWIDSERLISMRGPSVMAAEDVSRTLSAGTGPRQPGGILVALANALVARTRPVVAAIEDTCDDFEEALTNDETPDPSAARISATRRRAIELRRYLAPQREVMLELAAAAGVPLTGDDRRALRRNADQVTRLVEDLDVARERGAVTHEEVTERLSLRMNSNMYLLSIVAVVFLPLTFVTGLLGINVGGIPGAETGWAFLAICAGLIVLLIAEIWFLRRRHWLD
ncbi:MAG: CorA family divalent cation transporter [Halofilum sp. (in: g-proteobacteria)]|nr:CorA family divalent cation transporter [Halofilum sp. (in: g-proteobacteria)]